MTDSCKNTVADPGFPRGGGTNPPGEVNIQFAEFSQKLHQIERIWNPGGTFGKIVCWRPLLDPPLKHNLRELRLRTVINFNLPLTELLYFVSTV